MSTKERPILFNGAMVRAVLAGLNGKRKLYAPKGDPNAVQACPFGQPGDRLWVRETFSGPRCMDASSGTAAVPPAKWGKSSRIWYWADGNPDEGDWTRPRPSIHMPRWASRIALEIVSVRVERLNEISEDDALAEGITYFDIPNNGLDPRRARTWFRGLWESVNGAGSWDDNPWVWVVEFRRLP